MKQSQSAPIAVLLADDHAMVRKGIRDFLAEDPAIQIVGEASDGAMAWRLLVQLQPDVAVLDIRMPELNGIELTRRSKEQYPATRVLILTAYDDEPYVLALLRAGADGYVLKTAQSSELIQAIKQVYAGKRVLAPDVAATLIAALHTPQAIEPLTEREVAVVRGAAKGWTNQQIGQALSISERTVQGHLANVFGKLQVSSRTEMVTIALQQGLITLADVRP